MSQMHQMQLSYVPTEDRLLFRLNTKERQEFRFWMTRRYVLILWNSLTQLLAKSGTGGPVPPAAAAVAAAVIHDPLVEMAKKEIQHQELVSQADFKTEYQESSYLPLGEAPGLLFSVGIKADPAGQAMLCMHPEHGQGIEMVLNEQILHSLCKLVIETTNKADWKLNLAFSPGGGAGPGGEGRQGLN